MDQDKKLWNDLFLLLVTDGLDDPAENVGDIRDDHRAAKFATDCSNRVNAMFAEAVRCRKSEFNAAADRDAA